MSEIQSAIPWGRRIVGALLACGAGAGFAAVGGVSVAASSADQPSAVMPSQTVPSAGCASLSKLEIAGVEIVSATSQAADAPVENAKNFAGVQVAGLPGFCRVTARAHPSSDSDIGFEVWLPTNTWNGRFHGVGIGGFAGTIDYDSLASAIRGGQVGYATDTGHKGRGQDIGSRLTDASWAKGHPEKIHDYGSRAIHVGTVAAKQIVKAFYGRDAERAYFVGCSGGGRQGLMEAALYPNDYDGVMAGAPAASWTDLVMAMTNGAQAQLGVGAGIRSSQLDFLQSEILRQCDAKDGQADGLVADPRQCRLDTAKLACSASSSDQCFSPAQIRALDRIYAGPRTRAGKQVVPTFLPAGSEAGFLGWSAYIAMTNPGQSGGRRHGDELFANFVPTPFTTVATFDWDKDPARLKAALSKELDAPANLTRFFARGGKLIMWHGWADPAIPPENSLRYYAAVRSQSGARAAASSRLYLMPNVQHCTGGNGPNSFGQFGAPPPDASSSDNIVATLQNWVEKGDEPKPLSATFGGVNYFGGPNQTTRKRLICLWPARSVLIKGRDPDKSESYSCQTGS